MRDVDIGDLRVDPSGWHIMTIRYEGGELILRGEYHRTASQDQEAADAFRNAHSNILTLISNSGRWDSGPWPHISEFVVFDFKPSLLESFGKLVDACHSETSIDVIRQLDAAMLRRDGISALRGGLLLELLGYVAEYSKNWPLLAALVDSGPPYQGPARPKGRARDRRSENEIISDNFHRALHWIRRSSSHPSWVVATKMLRNRWLEPQTAHAEWIWSIFRDPALIADCDPADEPEATALFDALDGLGPKGKKGIQQLWEDKQGSTVSWLESGFRCTAPISLLRHIAASIPFGSLKLADRLMHTAVLELPLEARGEAGLLELLTFLVDEQHLDIDATAKCWHYEFGRERPSHSTLHAASKANNVVALRFLVDRGAKITTDEDGKTPAQRAEELAPEAARFWSDHLKERNLGLDFVNDDD